MSAVLQFNDLIVTVCYKPIKHAYLRISRAGQVQISAPLSTSLSELQQLLAKYYLRLKERKAAHLPKLELALKPLQQRAEIMQYFSGCLAEWFGLFFAQLGYRLPELRVRKMRSRWGSYALLPHRITLNVALARLERRLLDYVIVHELCHMQEQNHGKNFYALMTRVLPEWCVLKRELNNYTQILE